jgi:3-hydroxyacyl-[acyl-carrier-protein] dehydratase
VIPALLAAPVVLLDRQGLAATAALDVDAGEEVLSGHYPGFPMLPGVCVIDTVRRAAQLARPAQAAHSVLDAVESARFVEPVFPGDRMIVALRWERGKGANDWCCAAVVSVRRAKVGTVRLRYTDPAGAQ